MCVASGPAPATALAGTLDQQQTDSSGGSLFIHSTHSVAQTFTAGLSGGLDQVDLNLGTSGTPTAPLSVEIRNVTSIAQPGSMILASHSVPAASVPAAHAFVSINFATPAPVVAGTAYAIVAYSSTVFPGDYYTWWDSSNANSYPNGAPFEDSASPPDGAWSATPTGPLTFRTYVVTQPSNTFTFGKLKRNKKKGTALLTVNTPGPGTVLLFGKGIKTENGATGEQQSYTLRVIPKGKTKKKLRKAGQVKVKVKITFTPNGGTPNTQVETIKLIKKR